MNNVTPHNKSEAEVEIQQTANSKAFITKKKEG